MQMYTQSLNQATGASPRQRRMNWTRLASLLCAMLVLAVSGLATTIIQHSVAHAAAPSNTAVTTYKYDNARSGANTNETILNTTNVSSATFGKRVSYPVDGQVYAQPLYVPNLTIGGTTHNVVFAETEHDSIYAFDADQTTPTPAYLWQTSYLTNGATSVPYTAVSCNDLQPEIGITGTPVIDTSTNTMYVVADTLENGAEVYRLHAVDITTGQDKPGSPTVIQASVPGTGSGAVNGTVTFNPLKERQRGALLMANGQIYMAFGSFCDDGPYHGWILSYTYNGAAFQQTNVYNDTPNASGGGYWGGGSPLTADSAGNIYAVSGNGDFDYGLNGGVDVADAVVKLNPQLQVQDYMGPFNQYCLKQFDTDLGSGGPLLLPSQNEVISVGKEGRIYVMNTNNLGQYTPDPNLTTQAQCGTNERLRTDLDKVVQELPPTTIGGSYSNPVSWTGPTGQYVYFTGSGDHIKAFQLTNGLLSTAPTSQSPESFSFAGGNAVISSNGTASGTGILWQIDPHAVLRAYDATDLSKELYNTAQVPGRDGLDSYVKFSSPTVANGEVFVGTNDSLVVYGLPPTPNNATPTPTPAGTVTYNNIGISDDSAPTTANFDYAGSSYSSQAIQNDGINPGDNAFFNSMVFTWPNAVAGSPDNYLVNGQTIPVTPIANANVLGLLGAATGGPAYGTATINFTDGSTQTFQVGFSDWTLGGGGNPISFNNGTMATMAYRNTAAGKDPTITYIFYADVATPAGKVVQSVTLPTASTGGAMHVFAAATKVGTASNTFPTTTGTPTPTPTGTPTTTAPPYNNRGTSDDSATSAGAFDGANSYSAQALVQVGVTPGNPVSFAGVTFTWPNVPSGKPNNYAAKGQVIPITPASGDNLLAFLGSASGGSASGIATITYTDGSTQTFTLGFGDWTRGGNGNDPLVFGDQLMATTSYRNTPTGQQPSSKPVIFFVSTPLQSGKTIQSVTLPTTVTGGQLHVFTIATAGSSGTTPTPTPTATASPSPTVTASPSPTASPTPVPAVYNNKATSDDSAPTTGNFDGANSYSAQALQAVGITPGGTVIFNGVTFTWPTPVSGQRNNYVCKGQIIPVTPVSNATTLAFLGSASGGKSSGTATITYTDGSTQTFTLGFGDWTRGGNGNDPLVFGNQLVAQTAYRNTPTGQQQTAKPNVFYAEVALQAGKTVQSVTLPATTTGGQLHIFTVATK